MQTHSSRNKITLWHNEMFVIQMQNLTETSADKYKTTTPQRQKQ